MWFGLISLFPEAFSALHHGVTGRAIRMQLITLQHWNPRDFTHDKYRKVDDRPYGGGPGMLMKVQPLKDAIAAAKTVHPGAKVVHLSPQGRLFTQAQAQHISQQQALILVNSRYEGVDERLLLTEIDEEWSIGDYVLSGGELASMVVIDAITRCLPGVLGHHASAAYDSFAQGLLDHPHYTRPETINGLNIPAVLTSGDHDAIARWRLKQSLGRTWLRRPELLMQQQLTDEQQQLLNEFIIEHRGN